MSDFLIKSTFTLFVLLTVYYLFLEKEKIHTFNRFYLLFSLAFSMIIPFITIEVITEIAQPSIEAANIETLQLDTVIQEETDYLSIGLWGLYIVVTLVLTFRFIINIVKISSKMKSNTPIEYKNAKLILVPEKTLPHTFLNVIFINETQYHTRKIEDELYTHELTHVFQKHTLDILFIEILKTIFWFNPVFIFYKKAIQLNHEFLADEKVVTSYNNVPFYQNLLLSKTNENQTFYLASNLTYSITKKRLIMMTTKTSLAKGMLKKATLIPVFTVLIYSLCTKTVAQETNSKTAKKQESSKSVNPFESYYDHTIFKIKDEKGKIASEKKYNELSPIEKKAIPSILQKHKAMPTNEELMATLSKGGPELIEIDVYDPKHQKVKKEEGHTYKTSEITENPEFPGGMMKFYQFVGENYKVPTEPNLQGKVYVTFIIEANGSVTETKVIRDIGHGTGEEAIRVLALSPNWNPGKVNGEAVRTLYSLPITLKSK
jgi:beta-lactamase regulating signal transducer with metallopeptidase domain